MGLYGARRDLALETDGEEQVLSPFWQKFNVSMTRELDSCFGTDISQRN
jgi:hypothetical protein